MREVAGRRRAPALRVADFARDEVRARPRRGHGADRGPGPRGPQDVRRRRPDGARLRLRRDRDPVPAGTQGHVRRLGPRGGAPRTTRTVRPWRAPAGGALRRPRRAALQRGRRVRGRRRAPDQPGLDGPRHRSLDHAPRRALGRRGRGERRERVRLGLRDLGRGPGLALHRRVRGGEGRAPAADVLPEGRLDVEGHLEAGRDRLLARLRQEPRAPHGHRPWRRREALGRRDGAAVAARRRRSGRSCTRCSTGSRATR